MESDLNIRIEDEELLAENFATARKLTELLEKKRQATSQAGTQSVENS
jgi:acyl carrier protein